MISVIISATTRARKHRKNSRFVNDVDIDLTADELPFENDVEGLESSQPPEHLSEYASKILRERKPLCRSCCLVISKKLKRRCSKGTSNFTLRRAVMEETFHRYDEFLHHCDNTGKTVRVAEMYKEYVSLFKTTSASKVAIVGVKKPLHYRSFCRHLALHERISLFKAVSSTGYVAASRETVRILVCEGNVRSLKSSKALSPISPERYQKFLRALTARYKELKQKYMEGSINILDELRAVPVELWVHTFACIESTRDRLKRTIAMMDCGGDLSCLPPPFGNQRLNCREDLMALSDVYYRKMVRVLYTIQQQCFVMQPENYGPLIWSFSCGVSLKGGDNLLFSGNHVGATVHPTVLNKFKRAVCSNLGS